MTAGISERTTLTRHRQVRIVLHRLQCLGLDGNSSMIQHWGYQEHVRALLARFEIKPFD